MSQPLPLFTLTLRHLSGDGKKAGAELPKVQLPYFSAKQIHALLTSVAALAPTVAFPAEPEIRIKGDGGEFVVRVTGGKLHFVSWSSAHKSGVATPEQIVAAISGEGEELRSGSRAPHAREEDSSKGWREKLTMVALGIAILGVNGFTVWFLTKPPRTLVAAYRPIAPEVAERVLADAAGVYETGKNAGDRRLVIAPPSLAKRVKFGAKGVEKDVQNYDVKAVDSGGYALLTSPKHSLIKIKDNVTVELYGDTYRRVPN